MWLLVIGWTNIINWYGNWCSSKTYHASEQYVEYLSKHNQVYDITTTWGNLNFILIWYLHIQAINKDKYLLYILVQNISLFIECGDVSTWCCPVRVNTKKLALQLFNKIESIWVSVASASCEFTVTANFTADTWKFDT